jgi:hypothetical protein
MNRRSVILGKSSLSRVPTLNHFFGGEGLIFWRRSFGKSFFVLLWSRDSNFVIFGGRLIEFWIFPSSLEAVFCADSHLAHRPRGHRAPSTRCPVHRVRRLFFRARGSIRLGLWFWLQGVCRTVRKQVTDGPFFVGSY